MTSEQIRKVVKITLDELQKRNQYKPHSYTSVLKIIEPRLYKHFELNDTKITQALNQLADDKYIEVIYAIYRDNKTLEWLAEYYERDVTTVKRNKKRLLIKLCEILEGDND